MAGKVSWLLVHKKNFLTNNSYVFPKSFHFNFNCHFYYCLFQVNYFLNATVFKFDSNLLPTTNQITIHNNKNSNSLYSAFTFIKHFDIHCLIRSSENSCYKGQCHISFRTEEINGLWNILHTAKPETSLGLSNLRTLCYITLPFCNKNFHVDVRSLT